MSTLMKQTFQVEKDLEGEAHSARKQREYMVLLKPM